MECPICFELIDEHLLPCGHRVHRKCILQWRKDSKPQCPICLSYIALDVKIEYTLKEIPAEENDTYWVYYERFLMGKNLIEHSLDETINIDERETFLISDVAALTNEIVQLLNNNKSVYLYGEDAPTISACVIISMEHVTKYAIKQRMPQFTFSKYLDQYERPLTVLISGCRHSSLEFKNIITHELQQLPKYSTIIHGGCKGIDMTSDKIAKSLHLITRIYLADWEIYGHGAGPIRNNKMIEHELIDKCLAFHPDISYSKGTKHMINQCLQNKIPVYLHDFKDVTKVDKFFW
jgi:hypothetical protein